VTVSIRGDVTRGIYPDTLKKVWHIKVTEGWRTRHNDWNRSSSCSEVELINPNTKRAGARRELRTIAQKIKAYKKHKAGAVRLSDLIIAVARLLFASDPALATLLATCPRSALNANVRVLERTVTMYGSHVAAKVVLAGERASARRMRAGVGLGPVGVVGLPMGLEIEGPGEGSRTIGALILLLRIVGNQLNLLVVHAGQVRFRGGGRRRDGARRSKGGLAANDWSLSLGTSGGGVFRHRCQHGGHNRKRGFIVGAGIPGRIRGHDGRVVWGGRVAVEAKGGRQLADLVGRVLGKVLHHGDLGEVEIEVERQVGRGGGTENWAGAVYGAGMVREGVVIRRV